MAFVMPGTTPTGAPAAVVPTGGPPGLTGASGQPGRDGIDGVDGRDGTDGRDGNDGVGAVQTRVARVPISAWTAVISDGSDGIRPADPTNPDHRGLVIGIVAQPVTAGATASLTSVGDLRGNPGPWSAGQRLYVGAGGAVRPVPPGQGWWQSVGTAVNPAQVVVLLDVARLRQGGGTFPPGVELDTLMRAGRRAVRDADATLLASDSYVAMTQLTNPRTWTLPRAADYPVGQPLFLADETGACTPEVPITVAGTGNDTIGGLPSVALGSPYQKICLHSNGLNLWTV